ncbi:MAG TPA: type I-U CRISPR-associated protein Csb2 [Opitutaceae bacterium]|nr:type I-U CRISPR-associated protein Csb2 [Opitutaceae bacterium]
MTVLELCFPAGRFHATPWGRHVNEGAVEWPPSPWRIIRALIATWHLKAKADIANTTMRSLVERLCAPPRFYLPPAIASHARHYMPYNEGKNERTTKVFDTFIQLAEGSAILVAWDMDLAADERTALKTLAEQLGYFGRAESLAIARVLEGVTGIEANAVPQDNAAPLPRKTELVRLLAPMTSKKYAEWHSAFCSASASAADAPAEEGKKRKDVKSKAKARPNVPEDLFAALHADTGDLQAAGWNLPPGAQFVNYSRREDAFAPAARPRAPRHGPLPTVARYAVVSTVAPRITQAVSIGNRVHAALCKWSDQGRGRAAVFTGLDDCGKPRADHQHAHIFCEANSSRDAVTHITVWAPMGFDESACLALRRLNKVWGHGGHDLRLVLHAIGQPEEFPDCALLGTSKKERKAKVWRSLTPFVSTLHAKTFRDGRPKLDAHGWQQGSAAHDLLRQLANHPHGEGATIRQIEERTRPFRFGSSSLHSLQFQTWRDGEGRRGNGSGSAFEITFAGPIVGPLALGYAAHFGLGLFVPVS